MDDASTLPMPIGPEIAPARELGSSVIGGIAPETGQ